MASRQTENASQLISYFELLKRGYLQCLVFSREAHAQGNESVPYPRNSKREKYERHLEKTASTNQRVAYMSVRKVQLRYGGYYSCTDENTRFALDDYVIHNALLFPVKTAETQQTQVLLKLSCIP